MFQSTKLSILITTVGLAVIIDEVTKNIKIFAWFKKNALYLHIYNSVMIDVFHACGVLTALMI